MKHWKKFFGFVGVMSICAGVTLAAVSCGSSIPKKASTGHTTPATGTPGSGSQPASEPLSGTLTQNTALANLISTSFKNIEYNQIFNPCINGGKAPLGNILTQFEFYGVSNTTSQQQQINQQILVNYLGYYIAQHLNTNLKTLIGDQSIQANLGLDFQTATYVPTYGILVIPVQWGTNAQNRGTSTLGITIQFQPNLVPNLTVSQSADIANAIVSAFPVISIANSPILSQLEANATTFGTIENITNTDELFNEITSFIQSQIYLNLDQPSFQDLANLIHGLSIPQFMSIMNYGDLSSLPTSQDYYSSLISGITYDTAQGSLSFQVGWNGALSKAKMTVTGFSIPTQNSGKVGKQNGNGLTINQQNYLQKNVTDILGEAEVSFPNIYLNKNWTDVNKSGIPNNILAATASTFYTFSDGKLSFTTQQLANQTALLNYFCSYILNYGSSSMSMLVTNGNLNLYQLMKINFTESTFTNGSRGIGAYGMVVQNNAMFNHLPNLINTGEMTVQFTMPNGLGGTQSSEGLVTITGLQSENTNLLPDEHGSMIIDGLNLLPKFITNFKIPSTSALAQLSAQWSNFGFSPVIDCLPNWTAVDPNAISNQLALTTFVIKTLVQDLSNPLIDQSADAKEIESSLNAQEIYNGLFLTTGTADYQPQTGEIILNVGIAVENPITNDGTGVGEYNPAEPRSALNSPYTYYISNSTVTISGFKTIPTISKGAEQTNEAVQFMSTLTVLLNSMLPARLQKQNKIIGGLADMEQTFINPDGKLTDAQSANQKALVGQVLDWYNTWNTNNGETAPSDGSLTYSELMANLANRLSETEWETNGDFSLNFQMANYGIQMGTNWFTNEWCLAIQPQILVDGSKISSIYTMLIPGFLPPK